MSRFDEVIEEGRNKLDEKAALEKERQETAEEMKRRYIRSFKQALPEFYQALLKNDNLEKSTYEHKVLLVKVKKTLYLEWFIYHDSDGSPHHADYAISKDGQYYKAVKSYTGYVMDVSAIDVDTFAEGVSKLFLHDYDYYSRERLEKERNTDTDEMVFKYLENVIRYSNSNREYRKRL